MKSYKEYREKMSLIVNPGYGWNWVVFKKLPLKTWRSILALFTGYEVWLSFVQPICYLWWRRELSGQQQITLLRKLSRIITW